MKPSSKRSFAVVIAAAALLAGGAPAAAQAPGRTGPGAVAPAFEGKVTAYLLSPEADVAGLVLDDGQTVRLPPHLGAKVAAAFQPGDRVRVTRAERAGPGPSAPTVTSLRTGTVVGDVPAATAGEAPPVPTPLVPMKVAGQVATVLLGPRHEVQGVVLDSGAQVDFPPHVARRLSAALLAGSRLAVEGFGRTTRFGTALQATVLTLAGQPPWPVYDAAPRPPR